MKTTIKIIILAVLGLAAGLLIQYYSPKPGPAVEDVITSSSTPEIIDTASSTPDVIGLEPLEIIQQIDPVTGNRIPSRYACVGEYCDGSMYGDNHKEIFTVLQIPLIKDGGNIGCGADIFYAPHAIPKTEQVLDNTYRMLFDIKHSPEISADGFRNTVAAFDRTFYDRVTLQNGIAKVYLTGNIMSPGTCADPEFKAQIEAVAFQFESVKEIQVYLNDQRFDWCTLDVSGGEGFCKAGPRYWITIK